MAPDARVHEAAELVRRLGAPERIGRVVRVTGLVTEVSLPGARVGDQVVLERSRTVGDLEGDVQGEVVGFEGHLAVVMVLSDVRGLAPGARVRRRGHGATIAASAELVGRVIDPFGRPLDGRPAPLCEARVPLEQAAPSVRDRLRVEHAFETGVRAIDGLLTCGRGQRVGIFAGAGVGKTLLVRQILAQSRADVAVVGLVGERGCEVADLLASSDVSARAMVVVATSDRPPLERVRGARAATAIAEHFRDQGKHVVLVIDSLTRYAMALREIGLSAGEPPATKGYPPSVFAELPRLLERVAPMAAGGSITAFYTVLVEGDDLADPIADAARSLLDGHIVLGRDLASRGHFPAVDVLASGSRVARQVTSSDVQALAVRARAVLAKRREAEELRSLGAYVPGASSDYDEALLLGGALDVWLRQSSDEKSELETTLAGLRAALVLPTPAATLAATPAMTAMTAMRTEVARR